MTDALERILSALASLPVASVYLLIGDVAFDEADGVSVDPALHA